MFSLLLSITYCIAACTAAVLKDRTGYGEVESIIYYSGEDGIVHLIDLEEPVDAGFIECYERNPGDNTYLLFTRSNPTASQLLLNGNVESVLNSSYVPSKQTVVLVHGWKSDGKNHMNTLLTEAFLTADDVNVIVFDWSKLATKGYTTAKAGTAAAGKELGVFVNWLISSRLSKYDKIHLVGFSLGGHLVGNAGKETKAQVARITALDPAGPLWSSDQNRLNPSDAKYVEVIHTNTGVLGYTDPCGDADFYPNGGSSMPGCWVSPCSHRRSFEYMASSVKNNHLMANECADQKEANRNKCTGPQQPMGNNKLNKAGRGIYRVNTEKNYPY